MRIHTPSSPSDILDDARLRTIGIGDEMRAAIKRARKQRQWSHASVARAMGRRNINKTVRRLRALEDAGICDCDLLLRVARVLDIPLRTALALVTKDEEVRLTELRSRAPVTCLRTSTLPAPRLSWIRRFPDADITAVTAARVCGCMAGRPSLGGAMIAPECGRGQWVVADDNVAVLDVDEYDRRRWRRSRRCIRTRCRFSAVLHDGNGYTEVSLVAVPAVQRTDAESVATALDAPVLWAGTDAVLRIAPGGDATHIDGAFTAARLAHCVSLLFQRAGEQPRVERLEWLPRGMDEVRGFVVELARFREAEGRRADNEMGRSASSGSWPTASVLTT